MNVKNEIDIHEIDGVDTKVGEQTKLIVENVWNKSKCVYITITGGKKVAVTAWDLMKAIENATGNERI